MNYFNGIAHVGIPTQNFDESIKAYGQLGFSLINEENNQGSHVGFLQINNLVLEVYEEQATNEAGAINHIAIETDDVEEAFNFVKSAGFELIDKQIMSLPFWEHGIQYFNFYGPNHEILEVCQKNN